ncbi:MAG: hypothetical protein ACYTAQ_00310 [Planctomycetota bacterium]
MLTLGGAVSAAGGAVVIDMPAPPAATRSGIESPEPPESAPAPKLGDVALKRYARARHEPSYSSMASPGWWGWPYGSFGYGFGVSPSVGWGWPGWGWNRGWNCGWGWGRGWNAWGFPSHYGWGLRSPYFGRSRFYRPQHSIHWTGAGFPGRSRWR